MEVIDTLMTMLRDLNAEVRENPRYFTRPYPVKGDSNFEAFLTWQWNMAQIGKIRQRLIELGIDPDEDQSLAGTNPAFDFRPPIQ